MDVTKGETIKAVVYSNVQNHNNKHTATLPSTISLKLSILFFNVFGLFGDTGFCTPLLLVGGECLVNGGDCLVVGGDCLVVGIP